MTCSEFTEFLDRYLDGDLPPEEAREFERHLVVCRMCVAYLETYKQTVEMGKAALGGADGDEVPADVPEDLVKAILASRNPSR